jgi:4-hydroxybenzoate polyprenyltransferase
MMRALVALLRLRLVPTAWADVLAGAFLTGSPAAPTLAATLAVSSALYLFGMVTNDLFDVKRDTRLYPTRPIPSGTVSVLQASVIAAVLLTVAGAAAVLTSPCTRAAAAVLLVVILAYNLGGKRIPVLGPVLMGSCRSLNLLLGAWAVAPSADTALPPALVLGGYVACVTVVSAWEGEDIPLVRLRAYVLAMLLFPVGVVLRSRGLAWLPLAGLILVIAAAYPQRAFQAGTTNEGLVHRLLAGIYLLDAAFLGQAGRPVLCGLCTALGLYPLARRLLRSRRSAP